MAGLKRICKLYGSLNTVSNDGKKVTWIYDYVNDVPRKASDMTEEEIKASEKAKWTKTQSDFKK